MTERELMLSRIRIATADAADEEETSKASSAASELRSAPVDVDKAAALFADRCADYRAMVVRCRADTAAIRAAVTAAAARHGVTSLVVPARLDAGWVPQGVRSVVDDPPLATAALARIDAALTASRIAIASTGTIVLDAGPDQGRRALTLVPDVHICVVRAEEVVIDVAAAFGRISAGGLATRPMTLISGPSATSDIELTRVEGVHGPRHLEVVVAG